MTRTVAGRAGTWCWNHWNSFLKPRGFRSDATWPPFARDLLGAGDRHGFRRVRTRPGLWHDRHAVNESAHRPGPTATWSGPRITT